MAELERYRPSMDKDVLHSWATDAQKHIDQLSKPEEILSEVFSSITGESRDSFNLVEWTASSNEILLKIESLEDGMVNVFSLTANNLGYARHKTGDFRVDV